MAYMEFNINPCHNRVSDCTVRAIATAFGICWEEAFDRLSSHARRMCDMPDADVVWWDFLEKEGFRYHAVRSDCPSCVTVAEFCRAHPRGVYVIATQRHVLCAIDGDWYDTWNSGNEIVLHTWEDPEQ